MTKSKETHDWVSTRVNELADEVGGWYAQRGQDVVFGFDTAIASYACIDAANKVSEAGRRLGGAQAIAFGHPAHETVMFRKSVGIAFRRTVADYLPATVADLVDRDRRTEEFLNLFRRTRGGSTVEGARDAQRQLDKVVMPYAEQAETILKGIIETYNPFRPGSLAYRASR